MSSYDKIKQKILSTPTANDFTPKEIQNFLTKFGFVLKRSKGSHFIYAFPGENGELVLNIPMHNPVKPAYIDEIRKRIKEIEGE